MRRLLCIALVLAAAGPGSQEDPLRAWSEGRYQDAFLAFRAAAAEARDAASAALLYDEALAALFCGELVQAETLAEKAACRGGPGFFGRRDFLLGSVAFARCERAELLSRRPESGAPALDAALAHARAAFEAWSRAAASRDDWPAARRNAERALRKLDDLEKKRREARRKRLGQPPGRQPRTRPLPREERRGERREQRPTPFTDELSAEQLSRLWQKLDAREREKERLRRARQQELRGTVERDW